MSYDFPVSLENIYLKDGTQVPRTKAVVNTNTLMPLATVSDTYALIKHKTVMDEACKYMAKLGVPKTTFYTSKTGVKAVGEFTYSDKTIAVRKGDLVGLRVYAENTYNATSKVKIRVGGMVLACLNGMMMHEDVFSLDVIHKGEPVISFPEPEAVMAAFEGSAKKLKHLAAIDLGDVDMAVLLERAIEDGVAAERCRDRKMEGNTAWDFYNHITYDITHNETARSTYVGKLGRFNRLSAWVDETFLGDAIQ